MTPPKTRLDNKELERLITFSSPEFLRSQIDKLSWITWNGFKRISSPISGSLSGLENFKLDPKEYLLRTIQSSETSTEWSGCNGSFWAASLLGLLLPSLVTIDKRDSEVLPLFLYNAGLKITPMLLLIDKQKSNSVDIHS